VLQVVLLGLLVTQDPGPIDRRSVGRHRLMVALLVVMTLGTVVSVTVLAVNILAGVEGVTATVLLGRGAAIRVGNVIVFSLWYRQLDRGGPTERAAGSPIPVSFVFAEERHWRAGAGGVVTGLSGSRGDRGGGQAGRPGWCRISTVARMSSSEPMPMRA